jgi:hypothetical protein
MKELAPLPNLRVNQEVTYNKYKATITGCHWDGYTWRYEVYVGRGKMKGYWSTTEAKLIKE